MTNKNKEPLPTKEMLNQACILWRLLNLEFVRKMENIVYRASKDGATVYLRFTSPLRREKSAILAELDWILFLSSQGLPVVKIVRDESGALCQTIANGDSQFEACVFAKVDGVHPSKEHARSGDFLYSLGALIAAMHLKTELYKPVVPVLREAWNQERGFRHARRALVRTTNTFMKTKFLEAHQWLLSLKQSRENYGLIHSDLISHNLFIDDAQIIHVIDFDDSCYHWHAFDLAIVIYHLALDDGREFSSTEENNWLEHLLRGYRSVRPLDENDAKNIPKFVNFACLRLYFWIEDHQYLDTFMDDAKAHVEELKEWAEARIKNSFLPLSPLIVP